jgi:hypothetical protein
LSARSKGVSMVLSVLMLSFAGCAVPFSQKCDGWFSGGDGPRCIDEKRVSFIVPGKTTKDDVIGNLGFPSRVLRNGAVYAYDLDMLSWLVFFGAGYSGGAFGVSKDHLLLVEFDAENRVVRLARKEGYAALEPEFPPDGEAGADNTAAGGRSGEPRADPGESN